MRALGSIAAASEQDVSPPEKPKRGNRTKHVVLESEGGVGITVTVRFPSERIIDP